MTFTIIVTNEKIERAVPTLIWSPAPTDEHENDVNPKFRNTKNEEIAVLFLKSEQKGKEVTVIVYFQDFDSLEIKNVPGLKDQKVDRFGDIDPDGKDVTREVRGGDLAVKLESIKGEIDPAAGFYKGQLKITIPDKPGEYFIDITFTDKGKMKGDKEDLPIPGELSDRKLKVTGTKIDKPVTNSLKVVVR